MEKRKCELCVGVARLFCDSDQANLCWDCDRKVHGANFLVAKHTRCLLCSACQSPTSWKVSGLRLGPTVTICESCVARKKNSVAGSSNIRNLRQEINCNGDRLREDDDGAESYDDDEKDEESDDDDAENQVVPWDAAVAAQQPPVMSSSSSVSSGDGCLVVKRTRQELDLNCSPEESNESRPLKRLSRNETLTKINGCDETNVETERREKSNGCDSSSSSSTLVLETANKSRYLSR